LDPGAVRTPRRKFRELRDRVPRGAQERPRRAETSAGTVLTEWHHRPISMSDVAPQAIRNAGVDELLAAWQHAPELTIDLSTLGRFERVAGAIVANALLGSLGERPLQINLPKHRDPLEAAGIAFALANRAGPTDVQPASRRPDPDVWCRAWTPASQLPLFSADEPVALFPPSAVGESEIEPDYIGRSFAAFIDPHIASSAGSQKHPVAGALWPWLDRLLPRTATGWSLAAERRRRFIVDVGRLLSELILNVSEHAQRPASRLHSLVQVSFTHGGRGSFDRLYLTVQDTGAGIASTARPKLDPRVAAALDDHQIVFKLFDGSLPPWDQGRGLGLPKVAELVHRHAGQLWAATGTTRLRAGRNSPRLVSGPAPFRLDGTVVVAMLQLPNR
jgi:Histidine kinase-, DNA gyrase B-, and HSP90-like ATPase